MIHVYICLHMYDSDCNSYVHLWHLCVFIFAFFVAAAVWLPASNSGMRVSHPLSLAGVVCVCVTLGWHFAGTLNLHNSVSVVGFDFVVMHFTSWI